MAEETRAGAGGSLVETLPPVTFQYLRNGVDLLPPWVLSLGSPFPRGKQAEDGIGVCSAAEGITPVQLMSRCFPRSLGKGHSPDLCRWP
jgi:hypothetical protein